MEPFVAPRGRSSGRESRVIDWLTSGKQEGAEEPPPPLPPPPRRPASDAGILEEPPPSVHGTSNGRVAPPEPTATHTE